jgi:hypothetical protein
MVWNGQHVPRVVPSPQELSQLPAAILAAEIVNIEAVLANRYNPNGTFSELVDRVEIMGKRVENVWWADITRYRAALYAAQKIQAVEGPTGGIGLLNVRFHGDPFSGGCRERGGY